MNGSRVRVGEGRFITFVFFFIDKKGDSIENNKIKGYKSTLTTLDPFISAPFNSFLCSFDSFHHRGHGGHRGYNYL